MQLASLISVQGQQNVRGRNSVCDAGFHHARRLQSAHRGVRKQNFLGVQIRAGNRKLAEFLLRITQMPRKRR